MAEPQQKPAPNQCPRCRGRLLRDYYDDYQCLYCGDSVYADGAPLRMASLVPEDPRKRGRPRKQPLIA